MKKYKKVVALLLSFAFLLSTNAIAYENSTVSNAIYCIGVDHDTYGGADGGGTPLTGDFTENVVAAYEMYDANVEGLDAYYNTAPTNSYLSANTTGTSIPRIASRVVFLNGHANPNTIYFSTNSTMCMVSRTLTNAVRLNLTDMSTCELIAFFGCKSGQGTNNLPRTATIYGATTAIGFTEAIQSRDYHGMQWLEIFNENITLGETVEDAIGAAVGAYPLTSLSTYIRVYGDSSNAPISGGTRSSSFADSSVSSQVDLLGKAKACAVDNLNSCRHQSLGYFADNVAISNIVEEIRKVDPSFSTADYKVSINHYTENPKDALIIFQYFMDDVIETDKGYLAIVSDNVVEKIVPTVAQANLMNGKYALNANSSVEPLVTLIEEKNETLAEKEALSVQLGIQSELVVDETTSYTYSFLTGDLICLQNVFYTEQETGVILDYFVETVLN